MNYLARENLRLFLAWQEKYRRGYVEQDAWPLNVRLLFDLHLERKRCVARLWLAEKSRRWRKQVMPQEPRPIWTARNAFNKRRGK
jgi:hypothetical protein